MTIKDIENITNQSEARQFAIDWQNWASIHKMYLSELCEWQEKLADLALNWDLTEEFQENGII